MAIVVVAPTSACHVQAMGEAHQSVTTATMPAVVPADDGRDPDDEDTLFRLARNRHRQVRRDV